MAADANELALRYLLQLSSDVRAAFLLDGSGEPLASAPAGSRQAAAAARGMAAEALELLGDGGECVEIDILCERDSVMVLAVPGFVLVCLAERSSLPGIVLHEMRAILSDLARGTHNGSANGGR